MSKEYRKEMEVGRESGRTKDVADVRQLNLPGKDQTRGNSMEIFETADYYVVSFFPDAEEVEIDDKTAEKGYKAIMGLQDGHHVIMKVMYDKARYPLDEADRVARSFEPGTKTVMHYAVNIGDCAICKRLDANVAKVTEIRRLNHSPVRSAPAVQPVAPVAPATSDFFNTGNLLNDLMSKMLYDTTLNPTGKAAVALATGDKGLIEEAMPNTIEGFVNMFADFADLSQGRGNLRRSPEEVTAYIKALREGAKPSTETSTAEKKEVPVFRRASRVIIG